MVLHKIGDRRAVAVEYADVGRNEDDTTSEGGLQIGHLMRTTRRRIDRHQATGDEDTEREASAEEHGSFPTRSWSRDRAALYTPVRAAGNDTDP